MVILINCNPRTFPNSKILRNSLETTLQYLRESIERYNEFAPKMYQLIICESCEDNSCQEWYLKLNNCRDKLISIKTQFDNLNQPKSPVPNLTEQEDSITPPVPTNEVSPPNEPVLLLLTTLLSTHEIDTTSELNNSLLVPSREINSNYSWDPTSITKFLFWSLLQFILVTTLVYGIMSMNYVMFVNKNPPNLPK